jgi:transcriptional regulator with XRE-family HTH domain
LITSSQLRAARALLKITAIDLALISGVGVSTIKRFELSEGVPSGNIKTIDSLKKALENAGIEFIGTPDDRPGVRLK